jgi:hypothetical protein
VLEAIDSGDYPWLTAIDRSKQLIFKIGEVPVRFYRGSADEPNDRTLRQTFPELEQLTFSFDIEAEGRNLAFRFAVETDCEGAVTSVKFVGLKGEAAVLSWEVPLNASLVPLYPSDAKRPEGVELPPPTVRVPGQKSDKSGAA